MTLSLSSRSPVAVLAIMAVASCASHVAADTQSVQSGNWSDPATWTTGQLPDASEAVTISAGDTVVYDLSSARVAGVIVEDGATLAFHPDMHATLETDENVVVRGRLEMRPQAPNNDGWRNSVDSWRPYFIHTLRFIDVDETAFVGGGMDVLASDVGLWAMGDGVLDVVGAQKTGWVRLAGEARAGDTSIELDQIPVGWRDGDTIVIVPTEHPSVGNRSWNGFEERTIALAAGSTMHLDAPLSHDHPDVVDPFSGDIYTAEVLNLSRNVKIEGTGNSSSDPDTNGRAHVLIRSGVKQTIKYVELAHLGPRRHDPTHNTQTIAGRYPLHFHHSGNGSRGSLIEGVVAHTSGNRAFVPHASHGITFRDTIAYDVWEDAYWWDPGSAEATHDTVIDRAVAALIKDDPAFRGYRLTGFLLRHRDNNELLNSVAVGVEGNPNQDASGFNWPESGHAVWLFQNNIAHNNRVNGIFVWQNTSLEHVVEDFVAYRNGGHAVEHGAYNNVYQYIGISALENGKSGLQLHALPRPNSFREDGYRMTFEDYNTDGTLELIKHNLASDHPVLFLNCGFSSVDVNEQKNPGLYDFVNCVDSDDGESLEPSDVNIIRALSGMRIRVQRADGSAYQIDHTGKVTRISAFYDAGSGGDDGDTEPPSAPSGLTATAVFSTQVDLSWTASTDNVGVTGYRIYRDDSLVATVSGTSHSDAGLSASTTYTYEVAAIDAADNESARSSSVSATTLADDTDTGDDGSTDGGSTDGGSTDGGSTEGGSTDDGSTDGGSTDDGSTDGGSTDDGSTDDGSTDGGSTDGGSTDGGDLLTAWDGPQDFNGTSDFVDLGAIDVAGTEMTIAARFTADTFACSDCPSRDGRLVSKATGVQTADHYWMLSTIGVGGSTRLRLRLQTNGSASTLIAGSGNLQPGVSYHAAAVYDGAQMRLYLDGALVGSGAKSGSINTNVGVDAWIGANPDGSRFWDGTISDLKIYDRALSASEIAALHAGG